MSAATLISELLFYLSIAFAVWVVVMLWRFAWEDREERLRAETIRIRARRERKDAAPREQ